MLALAPSRRPMALPCEYTLSSRIACISVLAFLSIGLATAIPRRGNEPWSMLLCKFKDLEHIEPRPKSWFEQWLSGSEPDSIENYFAQVSNGIYTIKGSELHGWYTLPFTQREIRTMATSSASNDLTIGSESSFDYFDKIKELCIAAAVEKGAVLHKHKITVINAGTSAVYARENGVLLTPQLMFSSVITHEMVHSFYIGHSYSDKNVKVFPYALAGEYDDRYDLMSTANAYMHKTKYGMSGPGLNGAHLDYLGWLPMDRVLYFGRDGRQNYTLRLSSLSVSHSNTRGWLMVIIPYDRDDPFSYYTIELRTPNAADRGIIQPSILIHKVHKIGDSYYSTLLSQAKHFYELTENTEWVKFLDSNYAGRYQLLRVMVRRVDSTEADVYVSSTFDPLGQQLQSQCKLGEERVPLINLEGNSSSTAEEGRAHTADPLKDTLCVEGNKTVMESDVRAARIRRSFFTSRSTFGANSCKAGYVWRALDAYDYVCIRATKNEEAAKHDTRDSEVQAERLLPSGEECREPWVMRDAFPGDQQCVSVEDKLQALRENKQASRMLEHYSFFNGVDSVA